MTNFAFLVLLLINLSSALSSAPVSASAEGVGGRLVVVGLFADAGEGGPSLDRQLRGWTQVTLKDLRRWFRVSARIIGHSLITWWKWFRRASKFILIALLAALFDRKLISAWRNTGLRALSTYLPLMLYSYIYLLVDRRTMGWGKILLLAAVGYGVVRVDLISDRTLVPGLLDDALVIFGATWLFLAGCPEKVMDEGAGRALDWRRRAQRLRRVTRSRS